MVGHGRKCNATSAAVERTAGDCRKGPGGGTSPGDAGQGNAGDCRRCFLEFVAPVHLWHCTFGRGRPAL
eukprot:4714256-Alexandrium_andersonii.AAC.1